MTDFRIWLNHWIERHIEGCIHWHDDRLVIIPARNPDLTPHHYLIFWLGSNLDGKGEGKVYCARGDYPLDKKQLLHILVSTPPFLTHPIHRNLNDAQWIMELTQALYANPEHRLLIEFIMAEIPVEPPQLLLEDRYLC